MSSILEQLTNEEVWNDYLKFKENQASISKKELENIKLFIEEKKYENIANKIVKEEYNFSVPTKHLINKVNKSKKRVVYSFNEEENYILKLITYLFSIEYDMQYSNNCYSFRRKKGVKEAIKRITETKNIKEIYGYKIDISNYFNSVDVENLLIKLKKFLKNDKKLYSFLEKILLDDRAMFNEEIIHENKGIMAGVPISSFLANIYLKDVDDYFEKEKILYLRYSDDIILFSEKESINYCIEKLNKLIKENKLEINKEKTQYIKPNDKWDFLGFSYENGIIDISDISKKKIKGKIKRSARKIRKWMIKKDASKEKAMLVLNNKFNRKFYMIDNKTELTWNLWYFPVINTSKGLHEIDQYMQQCLRYISTGKYNKKNYNIKYNDLKKLNYRPLVSEYYKFKNRKKHL